MVRCLVVAAYVVGVSANPIEEALSLLQVGAHRPVHHHEAENQPRTLMSTGLCDCEPPCICEDGRAKVGIAYETLDTSPTAFNKTAKSGDLSEMKDFIRALIIQSGGQIQNDYGISVLAPYYTGDLATGTLDQLRADLVNPEWASYWSIPGQQAPVAIETDKQVMPSQPKKKAHKKAKTTAAPSVTAAPAEQPAEPELAEQAEEVKEQLEQATPPEQPASQADAAQPVEQPADAAPAAPVPTLSPDTPLDQTGYETIAAKKDTALMSEFIKHVVWKEGGNLKDEKPLQWFAKYHSGEKSTQNFKLLDAQLRKSDWIEGMPAPENAAAAATAQPPQQQH